MDGGEREGKPVRPEDHVTAGLRIKTDERTFKTLGDEILRIVARDETSALQRSALVNSARTFIEMRIREEGYHPDYGYRPMEYYMTEDEMKQPFCNLDIGRIKQWLQHNMNVYEHKFGGQVMG